MAGTVPGSGNSFESAATKYSSFIARHDDFLDYHVQVMPDVLNDSGPLTDPTLRRLVIALCVSLAMHGLVLWQNPLPVPTATGRQAVQTLTARLVAPTSARDAAPINDRQSDQRYPAKNTDGSVKAGKRKASDHRMTSDRAPERALAKEIIALTRSGTPLPGTPVRTERAPSAPAEIPASAGRMNSASAETPVGKVEPVGGYVSEDGLRAYRLALATQARRFKRYPAAARSAGATGKVDVRLSISADGRPAQATLARSSGHEVLDAAALSMVSAGAVRTTLPDSLRGQSFSVILPVVFDLDEDS